jgi:hypothetical protein
MVGSALRPKARNSLTRACGVRLANASGCSMIQRNARTSRAPASANAAANDARGGPVSRVASSARREAGDGSSARRRAASSRRHGESSESASRSCAA